MPWQDDSGDRLRDWTGLSPTEFYDPATVALVPMGFCYPGKERAATCRRVRNARRCGTARVLASLKDCRLTLLVGSYAQAHYSENEESNDVVRDFRAYGRLFRCRIRRGAVELDETQSVVSR